VGATITDSAGAWGADLVTHVRPPTAEEAKLLGNRSLCSTIWPAQNPDLLKQLSDQGTSARLFKDAQYLC